MEYILTLFIFTADHALIKESRPVETLIQCEVLRNSFNNQHRSTGFAACSTVQHTSNAGNHRRNTTNVSQLFN